MKNLDINQELRYEKKWIYNTQLYFQIINSLSRSKLKFKDQFKKRKVRLIQYILMIIN